GRYDGLIEQLGGRPTPGIGFATGLERVILNLKKQGGELPARPRPDVYVAHIGPEAKLRAVALAAELRRAGLGAVLATGDRRLRAQFRQADAVGARQALILGEDELARGVAKLHNLSNGEEREVALADLVNQLSASSRRGLTAAS